MTGTGTGEIFPTPGVSDRLGDTGDGVVLEGTPEKTGHGWAL